MLQLLGRLLLSAHMRNFIPVVDLSGRFVVDFGNFTKQRKFAYFWPLCCESEVVLSKTFSSPVTGIESSYVEIFIPVADISKTEPAHPLILAKIFLSCRDHGKRASPVNQAHMKRPVANRDENFLLWTLGNRSETFFFDKIALGAGGGVGLPYETKIHFQKFGIQRTINPKRDLDRSKFWHFA